MILRGKSSRRRNIYRIRWGLWHKEILEMSMVWSATQAHMDIWAETGTNHCLLLKQETNTGNWVERAHSEVAAPALLTHSNMAALAR